ncbi:MULTISPECIES: sugar transferase [unclassified Adlercreutzia]|uniref:sugar transferase n=1 Tax=unclassified Adlercreutzia TaxID=2636013 RepID=UPI0013EDDE83|nr:MULTISPECIES: sugar transferase [unclassified Adlercreutzia]
MSLAAQIEDACVTPEERRAAAAVDAAGKHEPGLRERGIPADVLERLLPGDDVLVLEEPEVAGGLGYRFVKRAFDVCACGLALAVLALPMAAMAVKVRSESPGSVIYAQERVGRGGKPFKVYKFRSMYVDAEARGARWAADGDPRVTPFGRWMRDHRLDELPQLWNVVRGDMSLIGPRPERPAFCEAFEERIVGWHYRTKVRPGLSGLAQVSGGYDLLPAEKVLYDMEYIENRSIRLDLNLMFCTLGVLRTGEGAK